MVQLRGQVHRVHALGTSVKCYFKHGNYLLLNKFWKMLQNIFFLLLEKESTKPYYDYHNKEITLRILSSL